MKKTLRMVGLALSAILFCVSVSSCSDDDDKLPPPPEEVIGTWTGSFYDEGDKCNLTLTLKEDNTGSMKSEYPAYPEDDDICSFKYTVTGDIKSGADLHMWGTWGFGEKVDFKAKISVNGNTMQYSDEYGTSFTLRKGGAIQGRDELSNTSWKLRSITGYAAEESNDWKGETITFGSNGQVTQIFKEGGQSTGSYTLSGNKLTFKNLSSWTDSWGDSFTYAISGNSLKLVDGFGTSSFGSTFNFDKN